MLYEKSTKLIRLHGTMLQKVRRGIMIPLEKER
jgi:hypothetical protein